MRSVMRPAFRDQSGVAKYRHEVLGVVLRVAVAGRREDRRADHAQSLPDGQPAPVLQVLARRRDHEPFKGMWALPSGPLEPSESMEEALARHLAEQLGLGSLGHCEQLASYSDPARDPYERTIATAYLGLLAGDEREPVGEGARWLDVDSLPQMGFDHHLVVERGTSRLRAKLSYTNIAFALAPAEFTMATLRGVYEAVLGHEVDVTNLSRVLKRRGQIARVRTGSQAGARGGRPPSIWAFTEDSYRVTDPFAVLGPGRPS